MLVFPSIVMYCIATIIIVMLLILLWFLSDLILVFPPFLSHVTNLSVCIALLVGELYSYTVVN